MICLHEQYQLIYADPPWKYSCAVKNRQVENHYPTMELQDICNLKIPAADNCVLFLWATAPKLREALKVIEAWGFEYKTNAVWDKKRIGMGYYFRIQHELLLIGTKGAPGVPAPADRVSSLISEKRSDHSVKPGIIYSIIEKMYPKKTKLEMFARERRAGWDAWGNEVPNHSQKLLTNQPVKTCVVCGKNISVTAKRSDSMFCCNACRQKHYRINQKNVTAKNDITVLNCNAGFVEASA